MYGIGWGSRSEGYVGWMACGGINVITVVVITYQVARRINSMLRERCLYGTPTTYVTILAAAK
jgi:hypothetical protein